MFRVPRQSTSLHRLPGPAPSLSSPHESRVTCAAYNPVNQSALFFVYVIATTPPPGAGCPPSDEQVFHDPPVSALDWHCFSPSQNESVSSSAPSLTWEVLVDLIHFQHNIIWHPGLSQQHIKLARHPACDWVDSKPRWEMNEQLALLDGQNVQRPRDHLPIGTVCSWPL